MFSYYIICYNNTPQLTGHTDPPHFVTVAVIEKYDIPDIDPDYPHVHIDIDRCHDIKKVKQIISKGSKESRFNNQLPF